jgi:hypothetical protein
MKRQYVFPLIAALIVLTYGISAAEVPRLITYQGKLAGDSGTPYADGDYFMYFFIYADSLTGDPLWDEFQTVTVQDGLFNVQLGAEQLLDEDLFTENANLFLELVVGEDAEPLAPRTRLTSTAYAFHALTAAAAASGGGWVDDGAVVRLANANDKVGIGTSTPETSLDVMGNAHIGDSLVLGTAGAKDGRLRINRALGGPRGVDIRTDDIGATIKTYSPNGFLISYLGDDGSTEGSYFSLARSGSGLVGFMVDGNYAGTNSPHMSLTGADRSTIFDMSKSGNASIELPNSSVSSLEISNEAGVGNSAIQTNIDLDADFKTIRSRGCVFPTDGYVVVIATCELQTWLDGINGETVTLGFSAAAGVIPDYQYDKTFLSTTPCCQYIEPITIHRFFQVSAGTTTFYFQGKCTSGLSRVQIADLTVLFFPTAYGAISPTAVEPGETREASTTTAATMEDLIEERVQMQTSAIKAEFESEMAALRNELASLRRAVGDADE